MSAATAAGRGPEIRFEQVSLTLGRSQILRDVGIRVAAGQVHALVGPNGGGKSSLVKTLLGQMPHQGKVEIVWPAAERVVGYVPQALEFDRGLPMSVEDFMRATTQGRPAFLGRGHDMQAIDVALARVGMADKRLRRMGALSGGERQRVLLAQSLIPRPGLLVLDEPMAALDEEGLAVFEQLLNDWRRDEVTVLWVDHDLEAVGRLADRVSGLNRSVLFDGHPHEMLAPERLLALFSARPRVNGEWPVAEKVA